MGKTTNAATMMIAKNEARPSVHGCQNNALSFKELAIELSK